MEGSGWTGGKANANTHKADPKGTNLNYDTTRNMASCVMFNCKRKFDHVMK